MKKISWRKPMIEIGLIGADGLAPKEWIVVDTPVVDTTKITATKGAKKEFIEEGGGVVDAFYQANGYSIEFELFAKNGKPKPVEDIDGVIAGEYAVRITPEAPAMPGKIADRVILSCEDNLVSAGEGERWKYTGDVLIPLTGNKVKVYPRPNATKAK